MHVSSNTGLRKKKIEYEKKKYKREGRRSQQAWASKNRRKNLLFWISRPSNIARSNTSTHTLRRTRSGEYGGGLKFLCTSISFVLFRSVSQCTRNLLLPFFMVDSRFVVDFFFWSASGESLFVRVSVFMHTIFSFVFFFWDHKIVIRVYVLKSNRIESAATDKYQRKCAACDFLLVVLAFGVRASVLVALLFISAKNECWVSANIVNSSTKAI